jgi:hypothetical protein
MRKPARTIDESAKRAKALTYAPKAEGGHKLDATLGLSLLTRPPHVRHVTLRRA